MSHSPPSRLHQLTRSRTWRHGAGVLAAAALAAGTLSVPSVAAEPDLAPGTEAAVQADATGTLDLTRDDATGRVTFVEVTGKSADLAPGFRARARAADPARAKASAWLDEHAGLFGVESDQLVLGDTLASELGSTLTVTQEYGGVPVWGAALKINLDADDNLVSVNGRVVPDLDVETTPRSTPAEAEAAAIEQVRQDPPTAEDGTPGDVSNLEAEASLVVYEVGTPLGLSGVRYLAWQVRVTGGTRISEEVIVSDVGHKPLNRFSTAHHATRTLDRYTGTGSLANDMSDDPFERVWNEGDDTSGLTQGERDALDTTAESYWLFRNTFGFTGWDGTDSPMTLRSNRMTACPNASWNGNAQYISLCPGLDIDDVTAHEWGHAYTQGTSGLIYQYQAGALNESYSDVWGETVDLVNGREDGGETNELRTDETCLGRWGADTVQARVISPRSLTPDCFTLAPGRSAPRPAADATVSIAIATDAAAATPLNAPPSVHDGCSAYTNAGHVAGRWAFVRRGGCSYTEKAQQAVAAGALGIMVGDNQTTTGPLVSIDATSTIPVLFAPKPLADAVARLDTSVGKVRLNLASDTTNARWAIGEQATIPTAAGTEQYPALRDMWNPTCQGNPGKVSDGEYYCGTGDNGGVHFNSGVPNRAFSLFVDGGTYNKIRVTGVGLDKAAHIWWRTQSAYLTPATSFPDFARSLNAACSSLVGSPIRALSLEPNTPGAQVAPVTTADCASLEQVIAATELTADARARCNVSSLHFTPGGAPQACNGSRTVAGLSEDFEDGAAGWTQDVTALGTTPPHTWALEARLPHNPGGALKAGTYSRCTAGTDSTGLTSVYSPVVTVTPGATNPRLRFVHQVSLENNYDGARVAISVDGAPFVPTVGWTKNGPDKTLLNAAEGHPLLNASVWSSADLHTFGDMWRTSVLPLVQNGVTGGKSVQLRFDVGTDECHGLDGWAIDDVVVEWCEPLSEPAVPPAATVPATQGTPVLARGVPPIDLPAASSPEATEQQSAAPKPSASSAPEALAPTAESTPAATPTVDAATQTRTRVTTRNLRRSKAAVLTARVSGATGGRVTFTLSGKRLGSAPVVNGRAQLKVRVSSLKKARIKVGERRLKAAFSGTRDTAPSRDARIVRVRR